MLTQEHLTEWGWLPREWVLSPKVRQTDRDGAQHEDWGQNYKGLKLQGQTTPQHLCVQGASPSCITCTPPELIYTTAAGTRVNSLPLLHTLTFSSLMCALKADKWIIPPCSSWKQPKKSYPYHHCWAVTCAHRFNSQNGGTKPGHTDRYTAEMQGDRARSQLVTDTRQFYKDHATAVSSEWVKINRWYTSCCALQGQLVHLGI